MNKEILISATDLKKYFPVHKFMGGKQYVKAVDGVSLQGRYHYPYRQSDTGRGRH